MRIFCPAIGLSRPSRLSATCWSRDVLPLSRSRPVALPGADPRGRACRVVFTQHKTGVLHVLLGGPTGFRQADRVSWFGAARNHSSKLLRRPDSVVKVVRAPATQPKQPD